MKKTIVIIGFLCVACGLIDKDWGQSFYNDTDNEMYFYLHFDKQEGKTYPAYDELSDKPYLHLAQAHGKVYWSMWPTAFQTGTKAHIYAFSPDTLRKYSWEDVLRQKNYWFGEVKCRAKPIQFPDEFEYMEGR